MARSKEQRHRLEQWVTARGPSPRQDPPSLAVPSSGTRPDQPLHMGTRQEVEGPGTAHPHSLVHPHIMERAGIRKTELPPE